MVKRRGTSHSPGKAANSPRQGVKKKKNRATKETNPPRIEQATTSEPQQQRDGDAGSADTQILTDYFAKQHPPKPQKRVSKRQQQKKQKKQTQTRRIIDAPDTEEDEEDLMVADQPPISPSNQVQPVPTTARRNQSEITSPPRVHKQTTMPRDIMAPSPESVTQSYTEVDNQAAEADEVEDDEAEDDDAVDETDSRTNRIKNNGQDDLASNAEHDEEEEDEEDEEEDEDEDNEDEEEEEEPEVIYEGTTTTQVQGIQEEEHADEDDSEDNIEEIEVVEHPKSVPQKAVTADNRKTTGLDDDVIMTTELDESAPAENTEKDTSLSSEENSDDGIVKEGTTDIPLTTTQNDIEAQEGPGATTTDKQPKAKSYGEAVRTPVGTKKPAPTSSIPPLDHDRSIRFGYKLLIKLSNTNPLITYAKKIKLLFKTVQDQVGKHVWIANWEAQSYKDSKELYKTPNDLPSGALSNKLEWFKITNKYINPSEDRDTLLYLSVHFVTKQPGSLSMRLDQIGSKLHDILYDKSDKTITIYKSPYACQAPETTCLGWLYSSTKSINSKTFVPLVRAHLRIPGHISIGIQWRTLKTRAKRAYKWPPRGTNGKLPPQALHVDIDSKYAHLYANKAGNLWCKGATRKDDGLHLRLVPCFGGFGSAALDNTSAGDMELMAQKQQYFTNVHTESFRFHHIIQLDHPIATHGGVTLRRHLMSKTPVNLMTQRIFITVDKSWDKEDHTLVCPKKYSTQAHNTVNQMIPECLATYGPEASKWFTNDGLELFKDVTWNPTTRSTTSAKAAITAALVDKFDIFGLGAEWKQYNTTSEQDEQGKTGTQRPTTSNKTNEEQTPTTAAAMLATRATDIDVASLGGVYGRTTARDDTPIIIDAPTTIQFSPEAIEAANRTAEKDAGDGRSLSMSTAANTTESTRQKLRTTRMQNDELVRENAALLEAQALAEAQAAEATRIAKEHAQLLEQYQQAQAQIAALQVSTPAPATGSTLQPVTVTKTATTSRRTTTTPKRSKKKSTPRPATPQRQNPSRNQDTNNAADSGSAF